MIIEMDLLEMDETITTLHPDPSQRGVRIGREKYDAVRAAILDLLRVHGPMTVSELGDRAVERLQAHFDGSVMWYYTTVELNLEAHGELRRAPNSSPQKIELVNSKNLTEA